MPGHTNGINQFLGSTVNISLLRRGERYQCHRCKLNFVQQNNLDFYNSGTVVDGRIPLVYCPICTSCLLRFLPALRTFEDLAEKVEPYSLVTILDQELQNEYVLSNIIKTCIVASIVSEGIEASTTVTVNTKSGSKYKVALDEAKQKSFLEKVVYSYQNFSLTLAKQKFGDAAVPKLPKNYHIPEQHKSLGLAICDGAQVRKTLSLPYVNKIIVIPSIEQISNLISSNVYSKDELITYANAPIFGD